MKSLKKIAAVALASAMTMAMGVSAFATDVTVHFTKPTGVKNWADDSKIGCWAYGIADSKVVLSPVQDGITAVNPENAAEVVWPGSQMQAEADHPGWYKITINVTAPADGMNLIFNNWVGDPNGKNIMCAASGDACKLVGIPTTEDGVKKKQSDGFMITNVSATEYWCDWNGKATGVAKEAVTVAPASYGGTAAASDNAAADNSAVAADNNAGANDAAATNADGSKAAASTASKTKAPTTGDTVAVSVVLFGLVAAVAFVVSKKKANA